MKTLAALSVLVLASCAEYPGTYILNTPYGNVSSAKGVITYDPPSRPIIIDVRGK